MNKENLNPEITISKDKDKIDLDVVVDYLTNESYWAKNRSVDVIKKSIENSLTYSLFFKNKFIGFARVVTDMSTFAYLCDLFILPEYQNKQYGKTLLEFILKDPEIKETLFILLTQTAHEFYKKYGFKNDKEFIGRVLYKKN